MDFREDIKWPRPWFDRLAEWVAGNFGAYILALALMLAAGVVGVFYVR